MSWVNLLIRIGVTYLRQDFSLTQFVPDAHPWPNWQRFDYLVRTRVVSGKDAEAMKAQLRKTERGRLSPYHRAAETALRELTGLEAGPSAPAWRRLLGLRE